MSEPNIDSTNVREIVIMINVYMVRLSLTVGSNSTQPLQNFPCALAVILDHTLT